MSRGIPAGLQALAISSSFPACFFVELDWPGGIARAWNGYSNIVWGGNTWVGTGHLGEVGAISESSDLSANTLALKLSGIPSSEISLALANDSQGRPGYVYLGALLPDGTLASTPQVIFAGFIDYTVIEDNGETATITVQLAKEFTNRNAQPRRYTDEDQHIEHPTDTFFQFLAGNSGKDFPWGNALVSASGVTPGQGSGDGTTGSDNAGG